MERNALIESDTVAPPHQQAIGFLTANIHVGSGQVMWRGVVEAAEGEGVNLLCFPGGTLGQPEAEAQRMVVYDLASNAGLDGLISWSSTITGSLEAEAILSFQRRFHQLPMVNLAQSVPGVPTISVDSYDGMYAAIVHLIEVHGFRKLALLRGPASHFYAEERYRAYRDALSAYDIAFDQRLVSPPLHWERGSEAMAHLLDVSGLFPGDHFQAVVAVSDLMALGAIKELHGRGIFVPHDIAVIGFNDSAEGRLANPSLTSVSTPIAAQGARAMETVLARLEGRIVPSQIVLQSRLVVRQSCGCHSDAVRKAGVHHERGDDALIDELLHVAISPAQARQIAGVLRASLDRDIRAPAGRFLAALGRMLDASFEHEESIMIWQDVLSALRSNVLTSLEPSQWRTAEDIIGQARIVVSEIAQRALAFRQLQAERRAAALRALTQSLITTFDLPTLAHTLAEHLPRLGIVSGYLAIYDNPRSPCDDERQLILAFHEGGTLVESEQPLRLSPGVLVPAALLPQRRHSYVVEPLFFHEQQLGYCMLEIGPRDGELYEMLRGSISSAVKGALLVRDEQQARRTAEKADRIKTRLLANVSHELRTPLHIILEQARLVQTDTLDDPQALEHIQRSAEHQLRLINDLLDLSRAEINELDLYPELIDPRPLLEEVFASLAEQAHAKPDLDWRLDLPPRLPKIYADPLRLRQVLLNLLSNALKFTQRGHITLGAEVQPPHLHLWVADTGSGIDQGQQERIFEPFVTAEKRSRDYGGIGLGLSISRQLIALHRGTLDVTSAPSVGSSFDLRLPLPSLSEQVATSAAGTPTLLAISPSEQLPPEIMAFAEREGLEVRWLRGDQPIEQIVRDTAPAALAWDVSSAHAESWGLLRRLHAHPRLGHIPFLLYGEPADPLGEEQGLTGYMLKNAPSQSLIDTINAIAPAAAGGPILIVDDDPTARAHYQRIIAQTLPNHPIALAENGGAALAQLADVVPSLVVLDLLMPDIDGTEVLAQMRTSERLRHVPVVVISNKLLTLEDVKQLEQHAHVFIQTKWLFSDEEVATTLGRAIADAEMLPQPTSALVKRAIAYLHQNYTRELSRWELAQSVGVSEDYLSRVFHREIGVSPWEYLSRYRIYHAKLRLEQSNDSIGTIAQQVGFQDRAYFSRVFRKITGIGPQEFRERRAG